MQVCKCGCVMCDSTCGESLGVFVYPGAQGVSGVCFVLKDDWSWSSFISFLLSCLWGPPDGLQTPWAQLEFSQSVTFLPGHMVPQSVKTSRQALCTVYLYMRSLHFLYFTQGWCDPRSLNPEISKQFVCLPLSLPCALSSSIPSAHLLLGQGHGSLLVIVPSKDDFC